MSTQLAPAPIFRSWDNNGNPLVNGQLFTYQAGTTTPQATWTDSTQTVQNTNPVILNSRGEASVWLDPTLTYKLVLQDSLGNAIWTADQVPGGFTTISQVSSIVNQAYVAQLLNPVTAAETTAGVTPVNFQYPAYTPDRYVTNGVGVDMWQAIFNADKAANIAGANVNFLPGSVYGVNCTNHAAALTISSSWVCNGPQAIIRRLDFTTTTAYFTAEGFQVGSLTLKNLIFDGQVTAISAGNTPNIDIGALGSYNDNFTESLWSKPYGVLFRQCQYITVENCTFINFLRAGLRFDSLNSPITASGPPWTVFAGAGLSTLNPGNSNLSIGHTVTNCRTSRTRGCFGDGFYQDNSTGITWANCHVYDYQRVGYVCESSSLTPDYGVTASQYVNCVADFGHDAFIGSPPQGNYGFYVEGPADAIHWTNCESNNTSIGWSLGDLFGPGLGVFRPYTATYVLNSCVASRCNSSGYKCSMGSRSAHVVFNDCFAEVNSTAATYSASAGLGSNGFQLAFAPSSGGPETTSTVSGHYELNNCRADLVAMSAVVSNNPQFQAAAVNVYSGNVTNAYQFQVDIIGLSTKWLTSAGAADTAAQTTYELTTGNNYGYFGDIIFTGANNGGARFAGKTYISDCTNQTTGYIMLSSETGNGNAVMNISDTRVSLRTGGATTNNGTLNLSQCTQVDYRGQIGFATVTATGCIFSDADGAHHDRSTWGSNGSTFFQLDNCTILRNLNISSGQGASSSHYPTTSVFTGCVWKMTYSTESGLTILKPGGDFASLVMNGCAFIDTGSSATSNAFIFVSSTDTNFLVAGAGNVFDQTFVTAPISGHVIKVNATNFDAPQTIAGIYNTVFGTATIPLS